MLTPLSLSAADNQGLHKHFYRHRGPVTCAAPLPDSRRIITSGYDGAVASFDADSGVVQLLGYHDHLVNRVVVNASGTLAASCSSDFTIYLWDLQRAERIKVLHGHADDVEDFVFIDDQYAASVSRDWRVLLWDFRKGSVEHVFLGHAQDVLSINYHAGKLYTSGDDMTLRVWDLARRRLVQTLGPFATETDTCAIDPHHQRLVLGCDDGVIRIFDLNRGELQKEIPAHQAGIKKVACAPNNGDILSAAYDQRVLIWDAESLALKRSLEHRSATWERSFNWSSDGAAVYAGTFDGTVLRWDAQLGQCVQELGNDAEAVHGTMSTPGNACFNDVAILPDQYIAVVSDDGLVRTGKLSLNEAHWQHIHIPSNGRILANAISSHVHDSHVEIITGTHAQSLRRYTHSAGGLRQNLSLNLEQGPINSICVSQHPDFLHQYFVACYTGTILRLDRNGQLLGQIDVHENAVKDLALHPTQAIGVSCSAEGLLAAWHFDGRWSRSFPGHLAIIDAVDISPDGRLIASAGRDFTVKIHELESGALIHNIGLGRRSPKALCFISAHVVVVSNYWGELIRIDLQTQDIKRRRIAENGISAVRWRGDQLLASSYDGAVYLLAADDLRPLNQLRAMTQRINAPAFGE